MKLSRRRMVIVSLAIFLFVNLFILKNNASAEISYDLNSDSIVDIKDLALIANNYNMKSTNNGWNSKYDLNLDNIVDIFDLCSLSKHIGISYNDDSKLGNSIGNINNQGMFVLNNGWLYTNTIDSNYIYKMKEDGTQKQILNWQPSSFLNVAGGYTFYANNQDSYKIYRMNTDGSNIMCINTQDTVGSLVVYNGFIYYTNCNDDKRIYRIKFDGSERTKISDDTWCSYINISGNYMYYTANDSAIHRVNLDERNDSSSKLTNEEKCSYDILKDGTIYFINEADKYKLYKMNFDGTNIKKLNDDSCDYLNISGNVLYYQNIDDGGKMYAMKTDGTCRTLVTLEKAYHLNIAGNKIYYTTEQNNGVTHSKNLVNLDGSIMPYDPSVLGNLPGNINNACFAACDEKNIFVNNSSNANDYGIYRYDMDYTNKCYIGVDELSNVTYLNVLNGWAYYASMSPYSTTLKDRIYKIKADGSGQKMELSKDRAFYMTVAGDWIYYTTQEEDSTFTGAGPIHKLRTDGTGGSYVVDSNFDYAVCLNICGDYIYYINTKDNMTIYRIKTDGTGREKVSYEPARGLNVIGGYIYYNSDYCGQMKRMPISGGAPVVLQNNVYENFIVTNDKIYYVKGQSVYSSNLDGSAETFIINCSYGSQINIAGNYLYYKNDNGTTKVVKVN